VVYEIHPVLSRFTLKVHATGVLSAFGHSPTIAARDFRGQVTVPDDASGAASMEMTVKAASLSVAGDVKESDRREIEQTMNKDVLDVDKYPEITFVSTEVNGAAPGAGSFRTAVSGTLTLHGVSRPQQLDAAVYVMGDRLTANGQFTLRQSDFGIKPYSAVGGTIKLKDEIDVSFDIVARAKQGN
jgi:polyisoprenoid-binding protein YceI